MHTKIKREICKTGYSICKRYAGDNRPYNFKCFGPNSSHRSMSAHGTLVLEKDLTNNNLLHIAVKLYYIKDSVGRIFQLWNRHCSVLLALFSYKEGSNLPYGAR